MTFCKLHIKKYDISVITLDINPPQIYVKTAFRRFEKRKFSSITLPIKENDTDSHVMNDIIQ